MELLFSEVSGFFAVGFLWVCWREWVCLVRWRRFGSPG